MEVSDGERVRGTQWMEAGLDSAKKMNILTCRESNRGRPARRYTDLALSTPTINGLLLLSLLLKYVKLKSIIALIFYTGHGSSSH
jgi:hypothetical protein